MKKQIVLAVLVTFLAAGAAGCHETSTPDAELQSGVISDADIQNEDGEEEKAEAEEVKGPTEVRNPDRILLNPAIKKGMSKEQVVKIEKKLNRYKQYHINDVMTFQSTGNGNDYQFRYQENHVDSTGSFHMRNGYEYNARFLYHYGFKDDQVYAFVASIGSMDRQSSGIDYYGHYLDIMEILTEAYGPCDAEEYVWTDETYKDYDKQWNRAFLKGHFAVGAGWALEDMSIAVIWDMEGPLSITYELH